MTRAEIEALRYSHHMITHEEGCRLIEAALDYLDKWEEAETRAKRWEDNWHRLECQNEDKCIELELTLAQRDAAVKEWEEAQWAERHAERVGKDLLHCLKGVDELRAELSAAKRVANAERERVGTEIAIEFGIEDGRIRQIIKYAAALPPSFPDEGEKG